jgi:hypothetical protein
VTAEEMTRISSMHTACVEYVDTSGRLRAVKDAGLPQGYKTTVLLEGDEDIRKAIGLPIQISVNGDHGFKDLFTPEHPFQMVVFVDPNKQELSNRVVNQARAIEREYEGRVKVCVMPVPQE